MSGLSMRTRIITVVSSAAVVAPFALMGGSAHAADLPVDPAGLPVAGALLGGSGAAGLGSGLGPVDGVLGTATGLLGVSGGLPVVGEVTQGVSAEDVTEQPLGSLVDTDILKKVTSVADLTKVLGTVTKLVNLDEVLQNVTKLVDLNQLLNLDLDKLINLPVKVNSPAVKDAKHAKSPTSTVKAGALPHTGGNADMTAILLCAGLALAGTGVTLVTRRRNALAMSA